MQNMYSIIYICTIYNTIYSFTHFNNNIGRPGDPDATIFGGSDQRGESH